ncbi:hypothetical protein AB0B12_03340 [Streptomyces sp. NPDC044780]|uniref:hypothetical protein n=1 Tax=unclassified Streptomyces TaxID=2593676 RepID=UPI0033F3310D
MNIDPGSVFAIVALIGLPLSAGLLIVKVIHTMATRRVFFSRSAIGSRRGIELMAISLSAGHLAYFSGFLTGFDMDGSRAACLNAAGNPMPDEGPRGNVRLVESYFPLSRECRWSDGSHLELVPLWVNIVVFAAIIGMLAGVILLTRGRSHRPPVTSPTRQTGDRTA